MSLRVRWGLKEGLEVQFGYRRCYEGSWDVLLVQTIFAGVARHALKNRYHVPPRDGLQGGHFHFLLHSLYCSFPLRLRLDELLPLICFHEAACEAYCF
jgi:hypothetical protein